ncbi:MAG: hypothetical protein IKR13_01120 [Victivallales bacterium]|nr:hypothetical protein [Victivallales bacterium]
MKKLVLTLLFALVTTVIAFQCLKAKADSDILPYTPAISEVVAISPQERLAKLQEHVVWLKEHQETELAFKLLLRELQRDYTDELSQYTISQVKEDLEMLAAKNAKAGHINKCFTVPTKGSRKVKDAQARSQCFDLLSRETIRDRTEQFDLLRATLAEYLHLVVNQYINDQDREVAHREAILICKATALTLKKELIRARGAFISEQVITPYLCETEKLLFLARGKWWTLGKADYKMLCQSVLLLSHAFHTQWLYESTEETRMHFVRVYKNLKRKSKKREWEEFIVLSTLADSFDPSKHRGPEAWWSDAPVRQ